MGAALLVVPGLIGATVGALGGGGRGRFGRALIGGLGVGVVVTLTVGVVFLSERSSKELLNALLIGSPLSGALAAFAVAFWVKKRRPAGPRDPGPSPGS